MVVCWAVFEGVEYVPYLYRYDAEIPIDLDGGKQTQKKRTTEQSHWECASEPRFEL